MSNEHIERTYSAGSRPRTEGLFGLSWVAMITAGGVIMAVVLTQAVAGLRVAAVVAGVGVAVTAPLVIQIGGRTGYSRAALLWQWWRGGRRGEHTYRSGSFSAMPGGTTLLPGLLAPTRMYQGQAVDGHRFGMIHLPKFDEYTVVLRAWPQGGEAVDQDLVDQWVAAWGSFLASLGSAPDVKAIVPVIDTVPETGNRLMSEVSAMTHQQAPQLASQVMWELATQLATARVQLEPRIAITFEATTPERRKVPAEQALEIGRRLPGILAALAEAGVRAEPMSAEQVIGFVRRAYDPSSQADLEAAAVERNGHGVSWQMAGPQDEQQRYDRLLHAGAVSITWEMTEAPRGVVTERVLQRLLEPNPDLPRKRVAVVYRPHSAAEATRLVDDDFRNARVAEQNTRGGLVSATASIRVAGAEQARQEQARGHGLTRYGILITLTAPRGEDLPRIDALVQDLSTQARLTIRRCNTYQSAAFAGSLGVGVILPEHATVPEMFEG
ncbi:SCO6880 family protein [Nocardia sp. CNY236]|uniref:SCO6880 family protein n=1 Tax=Nocardia sp. CNY236 TaxID=1169152 RepID=UPI0004019CE7|nr:SCO6880 family protein [Nocardia sp. CNY236]